VQFFVSGQLVALIFPNFSATDNFFIFTCRSVTSTDNFKWFCLRHRPSKVNLNRHFRYDQRITFETNVPTSAASDNNTSGTAGKFASVVNDAGGSLCHYLPEFFKKKTKGL
jgi:hypothetical protein